MTYYELSFLTPNLTTHQKNVLVEKIEEIIKKSEGKIEETFIEKKKFAYPVKKQNEGFLGIILISLKTKKIEEIKNLLNKNENILRLIIERKKIKPKKTVPSKKIISEKEKDKEKPKKQKVKIEKLDEKLEEILK